MLARQGALLDVDFPQGGLDAGDLAELSEVILVPFVSLYRRWNTALVCNTRAAFVEPASTAHGCWALYLIFCSLTAAECLGVYMGLLCGARARLRVSQCIA